MAKQAARYFVGAHLSDMGICWSPRKRLLKETGGGFISHWHADNKLEPGVKHTGGKSRVRWEDLEITLKAFGSIFGVFQDFFWIMSLFLCSSNLDKRWNHHKRWSSSQSVQAFTLLWGESIQTQFRAGAMEDKVENTWECQFYKTNTPGNDFHTVTSANT